MSILPILGPLLAAFLALACEAVTEPSPSDDLGKPAEVKRGQVTVSMEQATYKEGAIVSARIANGLEGTIYAQDSNSDCSIAMLERREGDAWTRVPGCNVERIAAIVAIGPGRTRTVSINPLSRHFGVTTRSTKPAFGAGLYRMRLSYRLKPEASASDPQAVSSETFRIEP